VEIEADEQELKEEKSPGPKLLDHRP
jgi:hypothetical protein